MSGRDASCWLSTALSVILCLFVLDLFAGEQLTAEIRQPNLLSPLLTIEKLCPQNQMTDRILPEFSTESKGNPKSENRLPFWKEEIDSSSDSSAKIHLNGEGGLAIFDTGSEGQFPNNEFRVDEAKLFVEAEIWEDIYAFGELNLLTRETNDENFRLGELYVDFENVSKLWHREGILNVRAGRFDIPFGEEYLTRDAIDNPLISRSLSDLWGVDEGVQLYGVIKKVQYNLAVQNGGAPLLHDFNADKSVTGRVGFDPRKWLHVSFSGMRTGDLDVTGDKISELWFGNGFFRPIGSPTTTTTFHANLFQADGQVHWTKSHFYFGIGHVHYDDNDSAADNQRDASYYQLEGVKNILSQNANELYLGGRFSRITSDKGFPLAGYGNFGQYLFSNAFLTEELWRFSFGVGDRIGSHVLLKVEYSVERGQQINGEDRENERFWGAEVAMKF